MRCGAVREFVRAMEGIDLLAIQPGQLEYVFASNIELKATLSLKNLLPDGRGVAFKVKTSAVNRWASPTASHSHLHVQDGR